jgi:hypothetical protein
MQTENMDMARDLEACLNKTLDEKIGVCFTVQHFRAKLDVCVCECVRACVCV